MITPMNQPVQQHDITTVWELLKWFWCWLESGWSPHYSAASLYEQVSIRVFCAYSKYSQNGSIYLARSLDAMLSSNIFLCSRHHKVTSSANYESGSLSHCLQQNCCVYIVYIDMDVLEEKDKTGHVSCVVVSSSFYFWHLLALLF